MRTGEVRHAERGGAKPLQGVRILAAEQMQALPFATQLMAHLGAHVVKVEPPGRGDSGRASQPHIVDEDGRRVGATYLRNSLGKRSLAIDLKRPEGAALFRRLVPHFDVVAENFTPGAMTRLGLGYEQLREVEPELVYVSISGFGHLAETPYDGWPAYGPVVEAMSGIYEPNRRDGGPPPVVVAGALGDNATALFAVIGTLAALRHKERTGRGQHVDVAMYDSMIAMTDMVPFLWSMDAPAEWAGGGTIGVIASFAASDGYFVLSVLRDHQFERLARTVGHPEWIGDPRLRTRDDWAREREAVLRPAIEAWAADKTRLEACRVLCAEGIAAGPSNRAEDIASDPHVAARDMLIEVPRPDAPRPMLVVGNPVKLSGTAEGPVTPAPRLGHDTDAVLAELLDLDPAELASLREAGTIG